MATLEDLGVIIRAAETEGIPPVLLIALGIAESNLNPTAERWLDRTADAKAAIERGDLTELQRIVDSIVQRGSADVSFGAFQITWRFSGIYRLGRLRRPRLSDEVL